MILYTLRMISPYFCLQGVLSSFQMFSNISRSFKLRMRLRHFDRRFDRHIKVVACFPSPPQSPRKVWKPSKTSKVQLGQEKERFCRIPHPFDRMDMYSGEWWHSSGEWTLKPQESCSNLLIIPNSGPFGRIVLWFGQMEAPNCAFSFLRKSNSEGF